jgi:hypothetical protein
MYRWMYEDLLKDGIRAHGESGRRICKFSIGKVVAQSGFTGLPSTFGKFNTI